MYYCPCFCKKVDQQEKSSEQLAVICFTFRFYYMILAYVQSLLLALFIFLSIFVGNHRKFPSELMLSLRNHQSVISLLKHHNFFPPKKLITAKNHWEIKDFYVYYRFCHTDILCFKSMNTLDYFFSFRTEY